MKKKILGISTVVLLLIAALYFAFGSELGTNAMADIHEKYPDNIIDFDDYSQSDDPIERSQGYVKPEPRVFVPPSEESLRQTQEKVQSFDCATIEDTSQEECEALVALFASTNGAAWTNNTNWLQSTTIGDWYGVNTLYGGPSGLSLDGNNLVGTIPPEIGNLKDLMILDLAENFLSGSIPSELMKLDKLGRLELSNNLLSGSIPPELGLTSRIWSLSLNNNQLTGQIPAEIGQARSLWILSLSGNQLSGPIPGELGSLYQLTRLSLSSNPLSGNLPPELGKLYNLGSLSIEDTLITGPIPAEFAKMRKLSHVWLRNNQLSGSIPPEIGSMEQLRVLRLENNKLSGSLPPELKNSGLWDLYLTNNQLTGEIPPEIGEMQALEGLMLGNNQLSGEIPDALFNAPLHYLDLRANKLTGSIPTCIGNEDYLRYLNLSDNQFTGTIPAEIGALKNLRGLVLANNQFTGTIPAEIGALGNLLSLNISNNKFEGAIPESITNLVILSEYTNLGYNRLNVPQEEPVQSFLNEKDPDWYLTQAIQATVPCDSGGEIISRDGRIEVVIPAEACDGELDVLLAPFSKPSHAYLPMFWANNGFELTAWNEQGAVTQFHKPLGFTLYYADGEIGPLPEEQLAVEMYLEDYRVWSDAISTCSGGEYTRNVDENWLRLPVCHLTEFGLFNIPEMPFRLYIPIANK